MIGVERRKGGGDEALLVMVGEVEVGGINLRLCVWFVSRNKGFGGLMYWGRGSSRRQRLHLCIS